MRELRIPGLAVTIVHGDQVVYAQGYGVADASGQPVTPQTPMLLGSVSKGITALAIMQLVEAGQLDLDAPVQRVAAPDCPSPMSPVLEMAYLPNENDVVAAVRAIL